MTIQKYEFGYGPHGPQMQESASGEWMLVSDLPKPAPWLERPGFPRAVKFQCDDETSISLCTAFISAIGNKPEYWYLSQPNHSWHPEFGRFRKEGYESLYWTDNGWHYHTPKQFATAEEAHREYLEKVRILDALPPGEGGQA